ncbi:MAG: MogA/MoaB family molybdenum cofactor biosynthesis protein [Candidatus Omnitrophica bacterium]|nr:MogA/MoaB family molybdenum cofactor biosynthesis protein [Candidatus Omnitrophota bacterium]
MIKTLILTISDTRTKDNDTSAKIIKNTLTDDIFTVCGYEIVKDEKDQIKNKLIHYSDNEMADLILTTGGTGLGPRDITPEATSEILDKSAPGISNFIRSQGFKTTNRAILSRAVAGTRKKTLIINLPGSTKGAEQSLKIILEIIPHAIDMLKGCGH